MSDVWSGIRHGDPAGSVPRRNPDRPRASRDQSGRPDQPDQQDQPDVVVVGGGAAGLAAAATARAGGADVVLVTDGPPGGDCTWHGCVPTKSLLEAAAAGLGAAEAVAHARAVVARVARLENDHALTGAGVRVVRGRAVLGPDAAVTVCPAGATGAAEGSYPAEPTYPTEPLPPAVLRPRVGVVLATGSRPTPVAGLTPTATGGPVVADTDGWLDALEQHLTVRAGKAEADRRGVVVVVGGGPSGVELAQALARLGAAGPGGGVVLVEQGDELLPGSPGAGRVVAASLRADGVDVRTGPDLRPGPDVEASLDLRPGSDLRTGPDVRCDGGLDGLVEGAGLVLLATGRRPVLDVLGPGSGVEVADGKVVVDASMATTTPRVRAAGDVVGLLASTHLAVATGRVAAAGLLHEAGLAGPADPSRPPPAFDPAWVPRVVWTDPQVASVGQVPGGEGTRAVRVPLSRNDRAPAAAVPGLPDRARGGFAQVWVAAEDGHGWARGGRLAGALVVGPQAGETVAEVALVGRLGLSVEEWVGGRVGVGALAAHHPYPAWSWTWQLVADRLLRS